ncbi:Serine/threonine-protein kinase TAO3 [Thelohanellus kitauei]|uniref:non-specific serine/threonine protein kinase n=1 Tax=Thelohanellus kitauei TaxID=669202 RepID=A0A0C2J903_THEKT|nr:Serine/threonine-protein kinase TAO3 [Thelohanellus kitauei]
MEEPELDVITQCESLNISQEDPQLLYCGMFRVGVGSFGSVYSAFKSETLEVVAIKQIEVGSQQSKLAIPDIKRELEILRSIDHPNCIQLKDIHVDQSIVWIVMEFCIGSARNVIDMMGGLNEPQISSILFCTLQGLKYIHERGIIHRDIKANNILFSQTGVIKLADFGSASMTPLARTFIGTPYWIAPEVILAMDRRQYTVKADIWSLGITSYELGESHPPLYHMNPFSALYHTGQNDPPQLLGNQWSENYKSFTNLMLKKDPENRPSADEMLRCQFMLGLNISEILSELISICVEKARMINRAMRADTSNDTQDKNFADDEINSQFEDEYNLDDDFSVFNLNEAASKISKKVNDKRVHTIRTDQNIAEECRLHKDGGYINLKAYQEMRKSNQKKIDNIQIKLSNEISSMKKEQAKALNILNNLNVKDVKHMEDKYFVDMDKARRVFRDELKKTLKDQPASRQDLKNLINSIVNVRCSNLNLSTRSQRSGLSPALSVGQLETNSDAGETHSSSPIITSEAELVIKEHNSKLRELSRQMINDKYARLISHRLLVERYELTDSKCLIQRELKNLERIYQKKESLLVKLHEFETNYQKDYVKNKINELRKRHLAVLRDRQKDYKSIESLHSKQYKNIFKDIRDEYRDKIRAMMNSNPKEEHAALRSKLESERIEMINLRKAEMARQIEEYQQENVKISNQQAKERAELEEQLHQESISLANYQSFQLKQLLQTKLNDLQALHTKYTQLEEQIKHTCQAETQILRDECNRSLALNNEAYDSSLEQSLAISKLEARGFSMSSKNYLDGKSSNSLSFSSLSLQRTRKKHLPNV